MEENQRHRRAVVRVLAIAIGAVAMIALGTATLIVLQLRKAIEQTTTGPDD